MIRLDEFLQGSGISQAALDDWLDREWLIPDSPFSASMTDHMLAEVDAARAHLINDLQGSFGVNNEGIDIILHLLDQLHGLRHAVTHIRHEVTFHTVAPAHDLEPQDIP